MSFFQKKRQKNQNIKLESMVSESRIKLEEIISSMDETIMSLNREENKNLDFESNIRIEFYNNLVDFGLVVMPIHTQLMKMGLKSNTSKWPNSMLNDFTKNSVFSKIEIKCTIFMDVCKDYNSKLGDSSDADFLGDATLKVIDQVNDIMFLPDEVTFFDKHNESKSDPYEV